MNDRDCENCIHKVNGACNVWECKFEPKSEIYRPCSKCHNEECVFMGSSDTHSLCEDFEPKFGTWTPVSERLPEDRDWYLGIFKEPDTGWINPLPFICDYVGKETKATTKEHWILLGFTDRENRDCDYYFNLECVAWMPLPEPYKAEGSGE